MGGTLFWFYLFERAGECVAKQNRVFLERLVDRSTAGIGQCFGGTETYEKTTGVKFLFGASQGILTQPGTGITRDCTAICRQTPTCAGFTVDYEASRCQSYSADSSGHRSSLHDALGSNYFEKICLRGGESNDF
ncbi:hypothetical protein FOCC_FOCC000858 [Frankliniella occidentalis]|nr:hypothetical protein FOCC_FOCC000858 [Frankliniella occidentalis]